MFGTDLYILGCLQSCGTLRCVYVHRVVLVMCHVKNHFSLRTANQEQSLDVFGFQEELLRAGLKSADSNHRDDSTDS